MRKFRKIFLIISAILAAVGIIFIIAGVSMGGTYTVADDILGGKLSFGIDSGYFVEDSDTENMNDLGEENTFSKEEVKSIVLDGKYGEYEVNVWDSDNYAIQGVKGTDQIKYSLENGVMKVSATSKKLWYRGANVKAVIYVPKDVILESAKLNVSAGTLICSDIKTQTLEVNIGAGEGQLYNIEATDAKLNVGAGDGEIKDSRLVNCDLKVGLGDFDVEGTIGGNVDIDCGMGNVEMNLTNLYSDFNYTAEVGAGDVEIGDRNYSGISHNINLNNASDKTMNIKCGMGDVSVDFVNQ